MARPSTRRPRPPASATPIPRRPSLEDADARILAAVRAIPRGETAAYGEVAERAGLPGRARLAARVLSANTDPALPWHRVLRADGRIAFPEGSPGRREQVERLRDEGVVVTGGRVVRRVRSLDAALWGPPRD